MTIIKSSTTIGISIPENLNDEESGEGIVALLNSLRRAQGLSDLCVGAPPSPGLPSMIPVETLSKSS
jgi:hypothetical protein